jgi:hypothetical protein
VDGHLVADQHVNWKRGLFGVQTDEHHLASGRGRPGTVDPGLHRARGVEADRYPGATGEPVDVDPQSLCAMGDRRGTRGCGHP